jgi:hypothetical protein
MINRRRLLLGGAGLAVVAAGGYGLGRYGLQSQIASMLGRRLYFLKLDPDGVRQFAKDQTAALLGKKIPTWNRLKYHFLAGGAASFKRFYRSADSRSRKARMEDGIISSYLLSSDFFTNGMDESRTVRYVIYYDAARPCQNPFARPATDAPAAS